MRAPNRNSQEATAVRRLFASNRVFCLRYANFPLNRAKLQVPKRPACDHAEITMARANSTCDDVHRPSRRIGETMTAIIYDFDRSSQRSSIDETERLFSALGRYTVAELLELLYVGEEPGFFELMRGLFVLSDESRLILQKFLATASLQTITAAIDPEGRCVLTHGTFEPENPIKGTSH